ncbi:GldG family protein [Breznakiellaceae bacterium SP9]
MNKKQTGVITLLMLAIFVMGFLLSQRLWVRLDLSANTAYTLAPVSRNLYMEIPDQVQITYFLSDRLLAIHPLPAEIEDLLKEYANYSHGKIRYVRKDPVKAKLVNHVERLGIAPQQIETVEQDEATVATVYTGILIEYLDKTEVLPVVFSLNTLEYDISSRIRALVRGTERLAGVLVGDTKRQFEQDYATFGQALMQAGFQTRFMAAGEEIPETLPMLFVLGGAESLDEWALYRIDHYIQSGGRVLFALDGVFVDSTGRSLEVRPMQDRGLLAMVASYGASVQGQLVLDRTALALRYETLRPNGQQQLMITRYPHWIGTLAQNANPNNLLTAQFRGLDLYWASPLVLTAPPHVEAETLLTSTAEAWLMTKDFRVAPDQSQFFEAEAPDTHGVKILAASLSGTFPSWFSGKEKPVREGSEEQLPDLPSTPKVSRIIVIGDTDIASGLVNITRSPWNMDFLLASADYLGNDEDIMGIRNRQSTGQRLDKVQNPQKRVALMGFARFFNVVFIPLVMLITALAIAWKRRFKSSQAAVSMVHPAPADMQEAIKGGSEAGKEDRADRDIMEDIQK